MSEESTSRDEPAGRSISPAQFREVLGTFAAGVVIVTAIDTGGGPVGLTVSAFCSVSAEPPLVLVCVDRASNTLVALQDSRMFTVNILAEGRMDLAQRFASKRGDKFDDVRYELPRLAGAGPILHEDTIAYVTCKVRHELEAGDHWVFIGDVYDAMCLVQTSPLIYHNRTYLSAGKQRTRHYRTEGGTHRGVPGGDRLR